MKDIESNLTRCDFPRSVDAHRSSWLGWFVAVGAGLAVGLLPSAGIGSESILGLMLAGIVVGTVSAVAARSHPVSVAMVGGLVAAMTLSTMYIRAKYDSGYWPITNEVTISQYGSTAHAIRYVILINLMFVFLPSALGGGAIALVRWYRGDRLVRFRRWRGLCLACGYNLTGNVSGMCPECGTAIPPKPAEKPAIA